MILKAIIFDLFGVLTCTTSPERKIINNWKLKPEIHDAMQRAVCGQCFSNWEKYLDKVVRTAGIENSKSNRALIKNFVTSEAKRGAENVDPEVKNVLKALKATGFTLGFVSNSYPGCREILEKNGLTGFFKKSATIFSYEVGMTKQTPAIYNLCLKNLGVKPENVAMVGDSLKSDVLMSKKATGGKIKGILISKRPSAEAKKAGCVIIPSIAEVPRAVNELSKQVGVKRRIRKPVIKSRFRKVRRRV